MTGARDTQSAHVSQGRCSIGMKAGDDCCIPLSCDQHAEQHRIGERKYWGGPDGVELAKQLGKDLYEISGDDFAAMELLIRFKNDFRFKKQRQGNEESA